MENIGKVWRFGEKNGKREKFMEEKRMIYAKMD
jgi:hypothetical protein